jgi:DNA-binding FrmR family transcriptional regulator
MDAFATNQDLQGRLDTQVRRTLPASELQRPAFGSPRQQAVESLVNDLVDDIVKQLDAVRDTLDGIQQQVIESAAATKIALKSHVELGQKLNDEMTHTRKVVEEIRANAASFK